MSGLDLISPAPLWPEMPSVLVEQINRSRVFFDRRLNRTRHKGKGNSARFLQKQPCFRRNPEPQLKITREMRRSFVAERVGDLFDAFGGGQLNARLFQAQFVQPLRHGYIVMFVEVPLQRAH